MSVQENQRLSGSGTTNAGSSSGDGESQIYEAKKGAGKCDVLDCKFKKDTTLIVMFMECLLTTAKGMFIGPSFITSAYLII